MLSRDAPASVSRWREDRRPSLSAAPAVATRLRVPMTHEQRGRAPCLESGFRAWFPIPQRRLPFLGGRALAPCGRIHRHGPLGGSRGRAPTSLALGAGCEGEAARVVPAHELGAP